MSSSSRESTAERFTGSPLWSPRQEYPKSAMPAAASRHASDVWWMSTEGADGDMQPGAVIEVEISGIGVLRSYVVAEQ